MAQAKLRDRPHPRQAHESEKTAFEFLKRIERVAQAGLGEGGGRIGMIVGGDFPHQPLGPFGGSQVVLLQDPSAAEFLAGCNDGIEGGARSRVSGHRPLPIQFAQAGKIKPADARHAESAYGENHRPQGEPGGCGQKKPGPIHRCDRSGVSFAGVFAFQAVHGRTGPQPQNGFEAVLRVIY